MDRQSCSKTPQRRWYILIFTSMICAFAIGAFLAMPRLPKLDWSAPPRYKHSTVLNRAKSFGSKSIALTFDDGPDAKVTPVILDTLKKYNIKATFFVLGPQAKRNPQLLRRMVLEGHCIGNHTWTHSRNESKEKAVNEILRTNEVIRKATGNSATLFRPPYGIQDGEYAAQAKAMGMPVVLWTRTNCDSTLTDPKLMIQSVGTPRNGEIILCHDGPGRNETAAMLPLLLSKLTKAKYSFVTMPEMLKHWDRHLIALDKKGAVRKPKSAMPVVAQKAAIAIPAPD